MRALSQLLDVTEYRPCDWDLKTDAAGRARWVELFRWHLDAVVVRMVRDEYPDTSDERLEAFREEYLALFAEVEHRPESFERLDVLKFTELRNEMQLRHGFEDPYRGVKDRENEAALELLPGVLAEIDAAPADARVELLLRGLMAGNIFDLGARSTIEGYHNGELAFHRTLERLPDRPWLIDDVEAWRELWQARPPRHVVFFVDNAGSDIVLGCVPLARWMLQAGARVTLAANTGPALNDITAKELGPLLQRIAALDPVVKAAAADGRLGVMASGCCTPLIDLSQLDEEFVAATRDADLLMLHGMGRAVECNVDARFSCDVVRSAVLKDEAVVARMGARLFDCVFRMAAGG